MLSRWSPVCELCLGVITPVRGDLTTGIISEVTHSGSKSEVTLWLRRDNMILCLDSVYCQVYLVTGAAAQPEVCSTAVTTCQCTAVVVRCQVITIHCCCCMHGSRIHLHCTVLLTQKQCIYKTMLLFSTILATCYYNFDYETLVD